MDWTDFQLLYWFFKDSNKVIYLGTPDILKFTLMNSKETYYVSPEKLDIKSPKLKKFEENPEDLELSRLPKKVDCIVNYLPLSIVTSFKVMGKFLDLLNPDKRVLIKMQVPKKQAQYTEVMVHDLLPQFNISPMSYLDIEGHRYILGKKL
ncbi:MAG: hypothetical protein DRP06_01130 [Candidatus Aenigmatarchaeota archaeon]|nr:MAG: hypothetical protein DRP06_01130 [Candidatus Aenigmarchaeota archaeon]